MSSGQLETSLAGHPAVAETAVVATKDELRGHLPVGFVVLKAGETITQQEIEPQLVKKVRHDVGAVAAFRTAYVIKRLPKTRSGKVLRNVLRALLDGEEPKIPPTIDDIGAVGEIKEVIEARRTASKQ